MASKDKKPVRLNGPMHEPAGTLETRAAKVARVRAELEVLRSQQGSSGSLQAHYARRAEIIERLRQLKELGEEL